MEKKKVEDKVGGRQRHWLHYMHYGGDYCRCSFGNATDDTE
jgi:hypothetical protein